MSVNEYDSELEVARNFTLLSATDFQQLSRLAGESLVRISTAVAKSRDEFLEGLHEDLHEAVMYAKVYARTYCNNYAGDLVAKMDKLESRAIKDAKLNVYMTLERKHDCL